MESTPGKRAAARRALIEDVEWMVFNGETHAEAVARRMGSNPDALKRRLERCGRYDLIGMISRSTAEGRTA